MAGSGDSDGSANYSNCTLFYDSTHFKILAGLRASVGLISFLASLSVVILVLLFKKYKFFSQRLILNVAVAAMIHSFSYTTARVNYYTVREIDDPYCYFGGLFNHYTAAVELISIWFTTINIFSVGMCGRNISKLEPLYYVTTYALPALWFWAAIWLKVYGTSGGWCSVKELEADCQPFRYSSYFQFGAWFVPLYISITIILIMLLAVAIKYFRTLRHWKDKQDPRIQGMRNVLRNELRSLISYPIIYVLLNTFSFASLIHHAIFQSSSPVLTYLRVLTSPLRGAFIALAFTLDKDTRGRLTVTHCKAACLECVSARGQKPQVIESTTMYSDKEESYEPHKHITYNKVI